jgi:hypothetical protein
MASPSRARSEGWHKHTNSATKILASGATQIADNCSIRDRTNESFRL